MFRPVQQQTQMTELLTCTVRSSLVGLLAYAVLIEYEARRRLGSQHLGTLDTGAVRMAVPVEGVRWVQGIASTGCILSVVVRVRLYRHGGQRD